MFFGALVLLASCGNKAEEGKLILDYNSAYNQKDYDRLNQIIHDDIKIYDMGVKVLEGKEAFIDLIEWGEVFNSVSEVVELLNEEGEFVLKEKQFSDRGNYLFGKDLLCKTYFRFKSGRIHKINSEIIDLDKDAFTSKMDLLKECAKTNFPDEQEKMFEISKEGAIVFKKIMENCN